MAFDPARYHQLSNAFLGTGELLQVKSASGGLLEMSATGDPGGRQWKLVELGRDRYALRTAYLGDGFSLDVCSKELAGKEFFVPWLAPTGASPGQSWVLTPRSDGTYRLTNDLTGLGLALDTTGDTHMPIFSKAAALRDDDVTGQRWTLAPGSMIPDTKPIPQLPAGPADKSHAGPTDYELHARPLGVVRAVMIFVDFEDALGFDAPADVARHLLGNGEAQRFFREVSGGRMTLDVTVVSKPGWKRMSAASDTYSTLDFHTHEAYVEEAADLYADEVVFSDYRLVLVATPRGAKLGNGSAAFQAYPGGGAKTPSGEVRLAATFDGCAHGRRHTTLIHEVSHLFGLPDLYPGGLGAKESKAGCWSMLSDVFHSWGLLGWERHKNGWLGAARKTYVRGDLGPVALHPLTAGAGLAMVVLPIDDPDTPSRVYVIELAQQVQGTNDEYGGEGVLLYTVDATLGSGASPVEIVPKTVGLSAEYGNLFEAPFTEGRVPLFRGSARGWLQVVGRFGSSYVIQIAYPRP